MTENIIKEVTALVEEVHKLRETTYKLRKNCLEAMSILKDDPDAANAATAAWDILEGAMLENIQYGKDK